MYRICKKFEFDAGHRLMNNKGKCWNIHGHRYVVEVELEADKLDSKSMVIDFFNLKWLSEWLDLNWDHGLILNRKDEVNINHCDGNGYKYDTITGDPTAENMARYLYNFVVDTFRNNPTLRNDVRVASVVVHETPKCRAEYQSENS